MRKERAIEILDMLIDGIDPVTGEILPQDHVCLEQEVTLALRLAERALRKSTHSNSSTETQKQPYVNRSGRLNAGRPWTEEDDQKLLEMYNSHASIQMMCEALHRRPRGLRKRLKSLGFTEQLPDTSYPPRTGVPWLPSEEELLENMFTAGKAPKEIAQTLQRTERAILMRLERLGLIDESMQDTDE